MPSEFQAYRTIRLGEDYPTAPEGMRQIDYLATIIDRAYEAGKRARSKEIRELLGISDHNLFGRR